ncbi:MAG: choice-of-anchor Q domain-containing protein [Thermoanaerobaculia bacterium]
MHRGRVSTASIRSAPGACLARASIVAPTVALIAVLGSPAGAAVLTVGPDGQFPTVQEALEEAADTPGADRVRIQAGLHEGLVTLSVVTDGRVHLSGGWDAEFAARADEPEATVLEADRLGPVAVGTFAEGAVTLEGVTLRGGDAAGDGGGLALTCFGDAECTVRDLVLDGNAAGFLGGGAFVRASDQAVVVLEGLDVRGNQAADGAGGLALFLDGTASGRVSGSSFTGNRAGSPTASGLVRPGGVSLVVSDGAALEFRGNRIEGNVAESPVAAWIGGLDVMASEGGGIELLDNRVVDNRVAGVAPAPPGTVGSFLGAYDEAVLEARRNRFLDGRPEDGTSAETVQAPQVRLEQSGAGARILCTDSVVAGGVGPGLAATADGPGTLLTLTNLTVAGHGGRGLSVATPGGGAAALSNSIVPGDGLDLAPGVQSVANFTSGDPGFRDPALHDYRLAAGSPAIDAGISDPPGGLGPWDLDGPGSPRVVGEGVDAGAHEAGNGAAPASPFAFAAVIGEGEEATPAVEEPCITGAVCFSGASPGRVEILARVIGPRPNGYYWVQVIRFTPSAVEIFAGRPATGESNAYSLAAIPPGAGVLSGLVDRRAFAAEGAAAGSLRGSPELGSAGVPEGVAPEPVLGGPTARQAALAAGSPLLPVRHRTHPTPEPPEEGWFTDPDFPGFRFNVVVGEGELASQGEPEPACIGEAVCVAGAAPGRSELVFRLIGPRPNGFLWLQLVRFTPSAIELWVDQEGGGLRHYAMPAVPRSSDALPGLEDRRAFEP